MMVADDGQGALVEEIVQRLMRRHSTAMVLLHHAVAERLGLGPTDHKCLDVLGERGEMTGSELAAITGLTTGAVTGVVARLERAGYLSRTPDPRDGRKQILSLDPIRTREVHEVFDPMRQELTARLPRFDAHQLTAIAEFLDGTTELAYHHAALLRSKSLAPIASKERA
jgi:DNA-binding MarR family transcriptional regulator